jgi:type IV pilus assembly protein PilE
MNKKIPSFTLTELLIVLILIGILVLLALPNLMPLISKTKSTEAKLQLEHVYTLEKSHYYMYSKYTKDLIEIGFEQEKLVGEGSESDGRANYRIEIIDAGSASFIARATAIIDFDGDGTYNVWEINEKKNLVETIKD